MDLNLNWRVLDVDNKATYPTVENHVIHFFVNSKIHGKKHILGYVSNGNLYDMNNLPLRYAFGDNTADIFWYYTPTVPNVAKTTSCKKCGKGIRDCEYEDDGYCMAKFGQNKCKYVRYVKEYYAYND